MKFECGNVYHVYNQGNNRQTIFHTREDYIIFLEGFKKYVLPFTEVISWSLMPNHFHFMSYADERCNTILQQGGIELDVINNGFRRLLSGYARIFNKKYGHTGSLFRQKTKAKCLSEISIIPGNSLSINDYYFNCFHYVHQKPFKAGLIKNLEDWEFSSFRDYAGLRTETFCNKELATKFCSFYPETFIQTSNLLIEDNVARLLK